MSDEFAAEREMFAIDYPGYESDYIQKVIDKLEYIRIKFGDRDLDSSDLSIIKTLLFYIGDTLRRVYERIYEVR
jgi:hypothetical protein